MKNKENKYFGPPYSETKIYAARMSLGSSSCRSISAAGPNLNGKPAGHRCCCQSTVQTDGQTLDRFMTLTAYADRVTIKF